jgi:hypothetical protein
MSAWYENVWLVFRMIKVFEAYLAFHISNILLFFQFIMFEKNKNKKWSKKK